MATKRQRYMISVDDEMFNEIEDFRFGKRYNTRSDATQALIHLGLEYLRENPYEAARELWHYQDRKRGEVYIDGESILPEGEEV